MGVVDVFFGEYRHNLDAKGRIIVPAKFREGLGGKFYVTRGMDGCLFVYAENEWNLLQEKLQKLPLARKEARAFVRFFYSAATECILDKQGRINLPKTLCDYAELVKPCVFIGVSNRIEIWSEQRWEKASEQAAESFDDMAEDLLDFGL
jgi:MraZ protein